MSFKEHHFVNRGFLRGPMIPLYGCGAIVMLFVTMPFRSNVVLMYLAGAIGATCLELITGIVMENIFKVRYWDYSDNPLNFHGYICVYATLLWGLFTLGLVYVIHRPVEMLMGMIPDKYLQLIVFVVSLFFVCDFATAFKTAMDIRDILIKLEEVKEEAGKLHKRMDVVLAFAEADIQDRKEAGFKLIADRLDYLEQRIGKVRELVPKLDISDEKREELTELRIKISEIKGRLSSMSGVRDMLRRQMIKANPYMASTKYGELLADLKELSKKKKEK